MIDKKIIAQYNKTRSPFVDKTICHAPFNSINFEQSGNANACCYNRAHILGTYPQHSIRDMWFGQKAEELRAFILNDNLGGGCQLCLKQLNSHNFSNCKAKGYDFYADNIVKSSFQKIIYGKKSVEYPRTMEFELSNTCNLECVMCSGHFSSSIRKNREGRPAMINPYNEEFIKQLEEFIPHLKEARFLGGEPFLIDIYYDIWEMILRINPRLKISITTNGSVLNNRTKTLLNKLNCGIVISVDSIVKETYEKIRVNAKHETLMQNFEWLYDYSQKKMMGMSFAVCPMTENWHEMPELVEFCNKKQIEIYFNTVLNPHEYSIRSYDSEKLKSICNFYSSYGFKYKDKISSENSKHFKDLTNQIKAWHVEKIKIENNRKFYLEQVEKFVIKLEKKDGNDYSGVHILKLILSLEQHENLQVNDEFPISNYFFDPEYVKRFQKQPQEHFSELADELGDKRFFNSYLEVLHILSKERMTKVNAEIFSVRVKNMFMLAEDPLLKRIVKGMTMLLPVELMQLIITTSENDIKNKIIAFFKPEYELVYYSENNISELVDAVLKRIIVFVEKNPKLSDIEKTEKIKKYSGLLKNVLEKLPADIAVTKIQKQLLLPPVTEIIRSVENLSEDMICNLLTRFAKGELEKAMVNE